MHTETPALKQALRYISTKIESCEFPLGTHLPNLNSLAAMAGVSRGTMWQALRILKRNKEISSRRGSGFFVGNQNANPLKEQLVRNSHSWEAKRVLFEQDLLKGVFLRQRPLPTIGELSARYGASFRTIRKILNSLVTDGLLRASDKKFYTHSSIDHAIRDSVCLLWEGDTFALKPRSVREGRFVESLQNECSLADYKLIFFGINLLEPSSIVAIQKQLHALKSVTGFIIRLISLWDPGAPERYIELLMKLAAEQKPIAILDEIGTFKLPMPLAANRFIRIFHISGFTAGQSVGRMLLSLGHQQAAFITHSQSELWSIRRFQGLASVFTKAGYSKSVSLFSMDNPFLYIEYLTKPPQITKESILQYFSATHALQVEYKALRKHFAFLDPMVRQNRSMILRFRKNIKTLEKLPREHFCQEGYESLIERSILSMRRELLQLFMGYLFDKALDSKACTAWVCANDDLAIFALNYLRRHNLRVPEQISVVGFDGDPLGLEHGVTSFDFNFSNISRQMLHFITQPMTVTRFTKKNYVEMPGFIIRRDTTGWAQPGRKSLC